MKNPIVLLGMVLALAACQTKTETVYQYQPRPAVIEPQTQAVRLNKVQWKVLTKKELQETLAELEKNPDPNFVLFALTPDGMKALNSNLVEINRFIAEQNQVIGYYRAYTEQTQDIVPIPSKKPTK